MSKLQKHIITIYVLMIVMCAILAKQDSDNAKALAVAVTNIQQDDIMSDRVSEDILRLRNHVNKLEDFDNQQAVDCAKTMATVKHLREELHQTLDRVVSLERRMDK